MKKRKEHLTSVGLQKIVNIRATLNLGLSPKLKAAFPDTKRVERPYIYKSVIPDPYWFVGFTSGEGNFLLAISKSSAYKLGLSVKLVFQVTQHTRDAQFLKSIVGYLGCGQYSPKHKETWDDFMVTKFKDNYEKIIPFFKKYPLLGVKSQDFED
jgi:hypothetical protein